MAFDLVAGSPEGFGRTRAIGIHIGGSEGPAIAVENGKQVHRIKALARIGAGQRFIAEMVAATGFINGAPTASICAHNPVK